MERWNYSNLEVSNLSKISSISEEKERLNVIDEYKKYLLISYAKDADFIAQRFNEIGIDVTAYNAPKNLMESLKETIYAYCNDQPYAAISTAGITAELLTIDLYCHYLITFKIEEKEIEKKLTVFKELTQNNRLKVLSTILGEFNNFCERLHEIRKKRNNYIHSNDINSNIKKDSLAITRAVLQLVNDYSEYTRQVEQQINYDKVYQGIKEKIPLFNEMAKSTPYFYIGKQDSLTNLYLILNFECPFSIKLLKDCLPDLKTNYVDSGLLKINIINFPFKPFDQSEKLALNFMGTHYEKGQDEFLEILNNGNYEINSISALKLKKETEIVVSNLIQREINELHALGINGTPSFIIGNYFSIGIRPLDEIKVIIEDQIKNALYLKEKTNR